MKKRGKKLLAAWLTLILTLTMNPAVYADNTDAGETVAAETESGSDAVAPVAAEAESGAGAVEPVAAETESGTDAVSADQGIISEDAAAANDPAQKQDASAEEPAGEQAPPPENVMWIREEKDLDIGGGKTIKVKPGYVVCDEVQGFDTISWAVKSYQYHDVVLSGDTVYDPDDDITTVVIDDLMWNYVNLSVAQGYFVELKTKGTGAIEDSAVAETGCYGFPSSQRSTPSDLTLSGQKIAITPYPYDNFNDFCLEYSCQVSENKTVIYRDLLYDLPLQKDGKYYADIPDAVIKYLHDEGRKNVYVRICAASEDLWTYYPSDFSGYYSFDLNDILTYNYGTPTALEITNKPAGNKLAIGDSCSLGVKITPENIKNKGVHWTSLSEDIATVDQTGKVTGKKAGHVTISVNSTASPSVNATCDIEVVTVELTDLAIQNPPSSIEVKETKKLTVAFTPSNATDKRVKWTSLTPDLLSVEQDGTITGLKAGTAQVKVESVPHPEIAAPPVSITVTPHVPKKIDEGEFNELKWEFYDDGTLKVNTGAMKSLTSTPPWKDHLDEITAVEITGFVRDLGNVFYNMPELQSAKLPGQLNITKTTGYFYNCPKLETLSIEKCQYEVKNGNVLTGSVKKYGNSVLLGTKTATELPSDVQRIGGRAFYGQSLPYIKIPSSVKALAYGAFEDCKQLSFIVIEPNKPTFEGDPFIGCDNLTDVYYSGDQKTWNTISKKSKVLQKAKVHCGETEIPELVTVSFDSTGGDPVASIQVIKGNTIKSLPVTYREKYVLDGWYQDAGLTTPFEANKDKADAGMTLYAKWRDAEQYSVKFYSKKDENGQWILVEDQPVYEQMYATAPNVSGEADEQLVGWYTDEKYKNSFSLSRQRITEDLSLYARWTRLTVLPEKTVTVTVNEEDINISYTIECTTEVTYDGRKHIVGELDGQTLKNAKATTAVNPDIAVANLTVLLNGEIVTGISIQKFSYKNNKLPSNDGVNTKEPSMYIYPVLKFDKNDTGLKNAIETYPQFKKTLNAMMKPSWKKTKTEDGEEEWGWTNGIEPITVNIKRIDLTGVQVYTNADLSTNPKLKLSDNILVWKGKKFSRNYKKVGKGEDAITYCTKTTVPQLCYQRVFEINGKPKVKKLPLRPGAWKIAKRFTWEQDENDKWRKVFEDEPSPIINSTAFDYYFDTDDGTSMSLNTDAGSWVEYDRNGNEIYKVRCGYFDGSLPSIEEQTNDDE